jgi:hypothetical protein
MKLECAWQADNAEILATALLRTVVGACVSKLDEKQKEAAAAAAARAFLTTAPPGGRSNPAFRHLVRVQQCS